MQRVLGGGARPADEAKGPEGAKAEEQRPKEAAKPKQPPIPSMSQVCGWASRACLVESGGMDLSRLPAVWRRLQRCALAAAACALLRVRCCI